jgi:hypothetical protein
LINPKIKNEVIFDVKYISLQYLKSAITSVGVRKELYQKGAETAKDFITSTFEKG